MSVPMPEFLISPYVIEKPARDGVRYVVSEDAPVCARHKLQRQIYGWGGDTFCLAKRQGINL